MIKATFQMDKSNQITGYRISGHALFSSKGMDIVCAGVSALTIAITNELRNSVNVDHDNGFISVSDIQYNIVNTTLTHTLLSGLQSISEQYPDNLTVGQSNSLEA
ncbi:ribosomal-processing cysteine protease Prp [Latilactobacillus curvatus]|uniref:ribosomal-processing cysteine protease Prp n=1 Tax=Latilactobacillus curvatus TaxID=28038 RepID=UPI000FECB33D|nr:ribosomal-processing cysteine protease Prp [Latilactobacillus curvatus]QAR35257.1 ribosomal-processing cysteine protease Prp [Latilactobacillus curvatus]